MKTCIFEIFGDKIEKMFEVKICSKLTKFNSFLKFLLRFLFFREQILLKYYCFVQNRCFVSQNFVFRLSNLCDGLQKFEHRLVDQTLDTHYDNVAIEKISLFWFRFVKESSQNSSYRSPKRQNKIVTQNFHFRFREIFTGRQLVIIRSVGKKWYVR